jgi:hypothetical protein
MGSKKHAPVGEPDLEIVFEEKERTKQMNKMIKLVVVLTLVGAAFAADDVVSAVHGVVRKVDSAGHIFVVKTADGTEHTLHFADETTLHGTKDSWRGIKKGTEVVAHYTTRGSEDTAVEVDRVGKDGLKAAKGTVTGIDRGGKTLAVKSADGTEKTFDLTGHAAADGGKDIAEGTEKGAKVTVYYTEESGKKLAHFFEKY